MPKKKAQLEQMLKQIYDSETERLEDDARPQKDAEKKALLAFIYLPGHSPSVDFMLVDGALRETGSI